MVSSNPSQTMSRMSRTFLRASLIALAFCFIGLVLTWRATEAWQASKPAGPGKAPAGKAAASGAASLQTHRNIGKAYYEQGKYPEAIAEFQKVVASRRGLATDHLDLGLALMQANRLDEALGELTTARQMDSKLTAADYNLGILYKRELRYPDAEAALKRVIETDATDPAAWFNLGTVYFAEKELPEALEAFQHVDDLGFGRGQNFYVASLFHTFTTLVRLKRQPEAQRYLKIHEKLRDKVPTISLQNPALEGGKYGAILVPTAPPAGHKALTEKVAFAEITSRLGLALPAMAYLPETGSRKEIKSAEYSLDFARKELVPLFGRSVALGDYDGDGRADLYVVDPSGTNHMFRSNADRTLTDVTDKAGVAGHGGGISAVFADYDNSGHASLFVAGLAGVTLYRNNGDGTFTDQTERSGLKMPAGLLATRAVPFDADNDGFLDLVVTGYTDLSAPPGKDAFAFPGDFTGATAHFYHNNGDGTFTESGPSSAFAPLKGRWRNAVFADFNNDGYTDLLLLRDDGPPVLLMNEGEDKFVDRTREAGPALAESRALNAHVADFNHDGNFDVALWSPEGYRVLLNRGDGKFTEAKSLPTFAPPAGIFAFRGTVADVDGDGFDDLLALDAAGTWRLVANRGGRFREIPISLPAKANSKPIRSLTPAWLGAPDRLDLVALTRDGELVAYEKQGPPSRWLEVKLNGFKSNAQGVGTVVELKAGNFYDKVLATGGPVRVYTGDFTRLDVVRVTWPNAVVQNSINVATNKPIEVRESERLASSCPLLYVWDGDRYVFLTDVLGAAPLGELNPDGSRLRPNPEEFVRLPHDLRAQDGLYTFQLTDELREVDYFDQLRLMAVDHPAAEDIYANEIYSSSPQAPALYAVRDKHFPIAAVDDASRAVLPLLRKADGRYPTDFRRDRIPGLADLHSLTVDLGDVPQGRTLTLWLTGWVFWTDSNAARALMLNRQLQLAPPYLQVRDAQGRWVTVIPDMGLPSGTNRTMRVDLTGKFLSPDRHVRILTNLCIYWDQIFFSTNDEPTQPSAELPLVSADLHYRGFSTPASDPEHLRPDSFDYVNVMNEAPWNPMAGNYTRYGPVEELLNRSDNRLVVMATGDELTARFSGRGLPSLTPGWKRDFFLYAAGYAKDGEPNTAFSRTVNPLPFRRMSNYPYGPPEHFPESADDRNYMREYETRPGYLLIPPLAPAIR